jgi:hypothetical protein
MRRRQENAPRTLSISLLLGHALTRSGICNGIVFHLLAGTPPACATEWNLSRGHSRCCTHLSPQAQAQLRRQLRRCVVAPKQDYPSDLILRVSIVRPVTGTPMQVGQAPRHDEVISRYLPRNGISLIRRSRSIGTKLRGIFHDLLHERGLSAMTGEGVPADGPAAVR